MADATEKVMDRLTAQAAKGVGSAAKGVADGLKACLENKGVPG